MHQNISKALQLCALEEHILVVPQYSLAESKEIIHKVWTSLTVLSCSQDLSTVHAYEVKSLHEHELMLWVPSELSQSELHTVDECAYGILLKTPQGFLQKWLQIGQKLGTHRPHQHLDQSKQ